VPPPLPWLSWQVGQRVVLRYRDAEGRPTEALGHLTEVAPDHLNVATRRGEVRVPAESLVIGKLVPESRHGALPHTTRFHGE